LRVEEKTNELTSLVCSLNFGSEEMLVEEYVQMTKEEFLDVEHRMAKLVNLA
jgi:hypothetical protein